MGFDKDHVLRIVESARYERTHGSFSLLYHPKKAPCPGACLLLQAQLPTVPNQKEWKVWMVDPDHWESCSMCSKDTGPLGVFVYMLPCNTQIPELDMSWAEELEEDHSFYPYYLKKEWLMGTQRTWGERG